MPDSDEQRGKLIEKVDHIQAGLDELKSLLTDLEKRLVSTFVTRAEFAPVRAIVYGFVGLTMVAVVGGLLALVVRK